MPRTLALLALAMLLGGATVGRAADDDLVMDWDGIWSLEDVLYGGRYDIVVADILAVRDSGATNSDPPRVRISVVEVLRGSSPLGERTIRWLPAPLYLPCPVGEEENVRRWDAAPLRGPEPGRRMILGGSTAHCAPDWGCEVFCRWEDSAARRREVRENVRRWAPEVERRRRLQTVAIEEARVANDRWSAVRDSTRAANESRWLAGERSVLRGSDLRSLVAGADVIVLAAPSLPEGRGDRAGTLRVARWLLGAAEPSDADSVLELFVGQREDPAARRWAGDPGAGTSGSASCLAFLSRVHGPLEYPRTGTVYRLVDGVSGLLLADSETVSRVLEQAARRPRTPLTPPPGCGADFAAFTGLTAAEAAGAGLKLTPTTAYGLPIRSRTLVLGCRGATDRAAQLTAGWFASCALPAERYTRDYVGAMSLVIPPTGMSGLLDSLARLAPVRTRRVSAGDSLSLTVRREVDGAERTFECTLDPASFEAFARILANHFVERPGFPTREELRAGASRMDAFANTPEHLLRENLSLWAGQVEPSAGRFWSGHGRR